MSGKRAKPSRGGKHRVAAHRRGAPVRAAQRFWQLPEDELDRLLTLTGQADRVELKLAVPADAHRATCAALGIDFAGATAHRVYYLDTPDRALHRHGMVARVRDIAHGPDDSVVKLRPVHPGDLPAGLRRSGNLVVEVDGMPGAYACAAALKTRLGRHDVDRVMAGRRPLHTLFSQPQRRLFAAHAPAKLRIDDLTVHGPVEARRRRLRPPGTERPLLAERWTFPDGSRLLELSTRCTPGATLLAAADTAAVLRHHGVDLTGPQQTKTRATLDFFTDPTHRSPGGGR
jgi:hypothetical protein